jgi:molybdenum cofactor cytidylyltransferase
LNAAGVILAAGFSRRLGQPKQSLKLGGETLMERALRIAGETGLSPVIAVVQPESGLDEVIEEWGGVVVLNGNAGEGIAASIRVGVLEAQMLGAVGAVLMTCDQVAVTSEHLRQLCAEPDAAAGSAYAGKVGIPAYFPGAMFEELMTLRGDVGAAAFLCGARAVSTEALAFDVDTDADVEKAREWLG